MQYEVKRIQKDNEEDEDIVLEAFIDEDENHKKEDAEYINQFKKIAFGLDHSLLVDYQNRIYSTGFNRYGRLGHGDEKDRLKFT